MFDDKIPMFTEMISFLALGFWVYYVINAFNS
jgi:hypothetical protein